MIIVEPWAEMFELPPKKNFDFLGESKTKGDFEIDFDVGEDGVEWITIYAWCGSTVKVRSEGEDISGAGHIEVPDFPLGLSVSEFTKSMFRGI